MTPFIARYICMHTCPLCQGAHALTVSGRAATVACDNFIAKYDIIIYLASDKVAMNKVAGMGLIVPLTYRYRFIGNLCENVKVLCLR